MKTILKVALLFTIILSLSVNAFASTAGVNWDYLDQIVSELNISDFGIAEASGTATYYEGDSISVELNLQQLKSDGWTTIKTWNGSGTYRCDVTGSRAVYSGYYYRVETVGRVYDSDGNELEEDNTYSPIEYY